MSYGQETIDVYKDIIVCDNNPITYTAEIHKTAYLDFVKADGNFANLNSLETNLTGQDRSVFMWIKKNEDVSGDPQTLFSINTDKGKNQSTFQIRNILP